MNALAQAKQRMEWKEDWRDKANNSADQELHDHEVEMEDLCRSDAIAYAAIAQAEALASIATHLGNIHQALLTPDANGEPTTVADQAKRIADALSAVSVSDGESHTVAEYLSRIDWTILNP